MQHQRKRLFSKLGSLAPLGAGTAEGGWPQWVVAIAVTRDRPTVRETGSGDVLQVESWERAATGFDGHD